MTINEKKSNRLLLCIGLVLIFLFYLLITLSPGTRDVTVFAKWMGHIKDYGFIYGYLLSYTYTPLSNVILGIFGKLLPNLNNMLAVKVAILSFFVISILTLLPFRNMKIERGNTNFKYLKWVGLFIFNIAIVLNSLVLGSVDIFIVPFLVLCIYFMAKKDYFWAGIFFALSFLVKQMTLIFLPVFLVHFVFNNTEGSIKRDIKSIIIFCIGLIVSFYLVYSPFFILKGFNPLKIFYHVIKLSTSHGYFSGNALNFNWIITYFAHIFPDVFKLPLTTHYFIYDASPNIYRTINRLMFFSAYLIILFKYTFTKKDIKNLMFNSIVVFSIYYGFNYGVHENHYFVGVILMFVLLFFKYDKRNLTLYFIISLMHCINLYSFYGISVIDEAIFHLLTMVLSLFFVMFHVYLFIILMKTKVDYNINSLREYIISFRRR